MDQLRPLKQCISFLTGCALFLGPSYLAQKNFMMAFLIIGMVLVVDGIYLAFRHSEHIDALSRFVIVAANIIICITQIVSGNVLLSAALIIVAGSLSILFFRPDYIKLGFSCSLILFIAEYIFLCMQKGELVISVVMFVECLVCITACFILSYSSVKNGTYYLVEAQEKQEEAEHLLKDLDVKNAQTENLLHRNKDLLAQIQQISNQLSASANALSAQADNLAQGSTEQAASMTNLTDTMGHISERIHETDEKAQQVWSASETVRQEVHAGNESMDALLAAMENINTNMEAIEKINKDISSIASQTNILALNASVEAARAGAAGKGFAVVAEEVRALAQHSAEAVKHTGEVLSSCQTAVSEGSQVANNTSAALGGIRKRVEEVATMANQISGMTQAQLDMVKSVDHEINIVTGVVHATAAAAEESSAAVRQMNEQAQLLHRMSLATI